MNQIQSILIAVLIILAFASAWVTYATNSPSWRISNTHSNGTYKTKSGEGLTAACQSAWNTNNNIWESACQDMTRERLSFMNPNKRDVRHSYLTAANTNAIISSTCMFIAFVLAFVGVAASRCKDVHIAAAVFAGIAIATASACVGLYIHYVNARNIVVVNGISNNANIASNGSNVDIPVPNANEKYGSAFVSMIVGGSLAIPAIVMVIFAAVKSSKKSVINQSHNSSYQPPVTVPSITTDTPVNAAAPVPLSIHHK